MSEHDHNHRHNAPLSDVALRVKALESLLTEKGLVDPAALDVIVEAYETKIGPRNGAKVASVARSGLQGPALDDATAAIAEPGIAGCRRGQVVENKTVHNLVVCTLCLPPAAGARSAAGMVQIGSLSCPSGPRSTGVLKELASIFPPKWRCASG
jgi:nitrile hydratase